LELIFPDSVFKGYKGFGSGVQDLLLLFFRMVPIRIGFKSKPHIPGFLSITIVEEKAAAWSDNISIKLLFFKNRVPECFCRRLPARKWENYSSALTGIRERNRSPIRDNLHWLNMKADSI